MKTGTISFTSNIIAVAAAAIAVIAGLETMHIKTHTDHPAIAFVDVSAIMKQSDAGKYIQEQMVQKQQELRRNAEAQLKEFKQEQEVINKQHNSPEELAQKNAALQKKITEWNIEEKKREVAINNAVNPAVQKIQEVLRQQLALIASDTNFTAILPVQDTFYADKGLDVTSEAIRSVNEKLPKVEVSFAEEKAAK